jgi:malate synthase
VAQGSGPYLYLPKLEHGEEALLWDEVLGEAEARLRLARGTIRVTVLIETLPAAFQMEEILWNLRGRICGLNCGRWDYIFSYIKTLAAHPGRCVPDRGSVTMAAPFLQAYSRLLVESCHRRGAHAMGGMAAQVPVKGDPEANERAFARVRADKEREVQNGHDGTWVAHPALVVTARAVFDARMPAENQLDRRPGYVIGRQDLLAHPEGACTGDGAHHNLQVALRYVDAWLGGQGCVQLDGLMEDAATAEISRAQLWQWAHHGAPVDGRPLRLTELHRWLADEAAAARVRPETAALLHDALGAHALPPFLTLPAYALLVGGLSS